ncbi:hypothetical protein TSACC_21698 [Terrimicrobium sacchariphilum]|uniref:Uncharacterized protein n=1 Tax=Terrimicrobium sacchariphilum TaxID=690879 RepID=A0A146G6B5_TERSA|nr:hypothetical protein TSACC_21698 [Terrimicrobium sacchariphilum]
MSPVDTIRAMYRAQPTRWAFAEELDGYLSHGWVINSPECFLMGREVRRDGTHEQITDPWFIFDKPDAWFVAAYAGKVNTALTLIPFRHRWVGWERGLKSGLRFHDFDTFQKTCESMTRSKTRSPLR